MVSEIHVISFGEIVIRALPPGSYMDDKQLMMKETGNSSVHWPQIGTPSPARRQVGLPIAMPSARGFMEISHCHL